MCFLTLQVHGRGKHGGPGVLVAGPRHDTTLGPRPGQVGPGVVGAHGGRRVPVAHLRARCEVAVGAGPQAPVQAPRQRAATSVEAGGRLVQVGVVHPRGVVSRHRQHPDGFKRGAQLLTAQQLYNSSYFFS